MPKKFWYPFVVWASGPAIIIAILAFTVDIKFGAPSRELSGPCALKIADLPQVPELLGFRLGMTADQVKARVPQVSFGRTDEFGSSSTTINPDFDRRIDKSSFAGVRTVSLDFLDGRLRSLWLGYDSTFKWHSIADFISGISKSLRLPETWIPWRSRGQQLRCADFQITVTTVAEGPSFHIVDQTAEDTLATRREAKEEERASGSETSENLDEIFGDKRSKIFYAGGCRPAKELDDDSRIVFQSKEDAEKAGYKLAKNCH